MNNSKKGFIAIIVLSLIFIGILGYGVINDKKISAKNAKEYEEYLINEKNNAEETTTNVTEDTNTDSTDESASDESAGFYDKLKAKQDVRVLILGDGLALSQGRNSDNGIWSQGVSSLIQTNYEVNVELKVVAESGSTTAVGLNAMDANDISGYDLVLVCYGQCDNNTKVDINTFNSNYTNIITKIKTSSPNATIIPIVPSTLDLTNTYRTAIMDLSTQNGLSYADMKKAFNDSGIQESSLANNGLPTDQGYQVYTQAVGNVIKAGMN